MTTPRNFAAVAGRSIARLGKQVELGLAPLDLSPPQYRLLASIDEGSALTSVLADQLAVTRPTVTAVVDLLVERGLIERRQDPSDRRRVAHELTAQGRALLEAADSAVAARLTDIAAFLDGEGEAAKAMDGLHTWSSALDHYRAAKVAAKSKEAVRA